MKVELYLKNINQEMIDAGRVARPGAEWVVSWPKECCVITVSVRKPGEWVEQPSRRGFMLRKEKQGGMFWDPVTNAVYKVDEEAYHALIDLEHGLSEKEVAQRLKVPVRTVKSLTSQLRRILK